ncbi:pentapeptide repeat-containing protein [Paenibacillus polymyxa]|uniref:M1-336 n=1 Tax=Paenibacillus polymyxa (strain SC2) TaxID=886882 RepID=E3EGF6_PAEPS|nr:pentapeptide repeat-containing protein [Paenibacillus polymyxa]ADO54184.1 M1-336 [Paenibacillus polymyxa SC2]WPQ57109.1 pentapeptide repeat-containing protein [Paenibacillus polymyxa]CCC83117.1 bTB/POZ domain-containing protein KCTD9 [Paenibacillus polymyxa M1]
MEKPIDELNPQQQVILNQAWFLIRRDWALKFKAKQGQRIQACVEEFRGYCRDIRQEQLQGRKGKIGYITYSMLRTTWLEERPTYLVEAANALWVLDPEPIRFEWDTSWTYSYWTDLQQKLRREVEKQHVSLPELEWEQVMLEAAVHIHVLVVNMMRLAIKKAMCLPEFQELDREETFEIRVGEYMDHTISVYKEDRRALEASEIRSWLEEQEEHAYSYQALEKIQLSDGDYSQLDFRYTAFRQIEMEHSRLHGCVLVGTMWEESQLDGIDLTYSLLHGADFSGCSMKGAILDAVMGNAGYGSDAALDWEPLGFAGVDFTRASLQGARFQDAQLREAVFQDASLQRAFLNGADLTDACFAGADVSGASFKGACLIGADFTGANVQGAMFTDAQRRGAIGLEWAILEASLSHKEPSASVQARDAAGKREWLH